MYAKFNDSVETGSVGLILGRSPAVRHGAVAAFAGASTDQFALEFS
jgi:hypothetical protein